MAAIVLFCLALLVCIVLRTNILYALLAGLVIFTLYGKKQGFSWKELGKMICSGVKTSASVLLVFPLIGILTAFWRACGTLPFIICCAVDLIRPEILLLMTFLLNCGVSMLTGTAFGTAATMGTICVSVGISMGMDPVLLGGAMLSGVYFGDRCSPVSTSALLVSELTETNIYDNIKRMLKTALVPFLLSCGVYAALGMVKSGSGAAGELWSLYGREMTLHWVMCLPAVLILILSVLRVNVKKAMSVSILAAVVLCIFLRHLDVMTILRTAILGYTASDAEVGAMLNGGGIISMVRVALIVMISSAYSGIFRKTGLLDGLCGRVTALRDKTSPYASMLLTAVLASLLACNQTLTIILTNQLCAPSQKDKEEFAINLENSAVIVAPLIPWSIAGGDAALDRRRADDRHGVCVLFIHPAAVRARAADSAAARGEKNRRAEMRKEVCMNGKTLLAEAIEMKDEIVENRRAIHRAPEVGAHLPQTVQFVEEKLRLLGYEPRELGGGVVAELTGEDMGRCILLRADMDALKVREKTDLPFRSENGSMHACGHDMHAAMLLGAARLLKAHQSEIKGTVKLVFQPDEEGFTGAKAMLKAGVLEAPKPQAAMALHVNSGTPSGLVLCGKGTFMAGCTLFRITVKGVGCHGAMPETGVDPINIAAHIYLALQEITARELPAKTPAIVTMGKFSAGHAPNIIPQEAVIEGTIRTFDRDVTALILRRIGEIADATARAFRGSASVEELASAPPLKNDEALTEQMARCAEMLFGEKSVYRLREGGMGSEDFASYTYELPCAYLLLGAGTAQEDARYGKPMHNESVVFNENILPRGSALLAYGAMQWLEDRQ